MNPKTIFALHSITTAFLVLYAMPFLPKHAAELGYPLFWFGLALGLGLLCVGPKSWSKA